LNTATVGSSRLGGIEPSVKWQTTGSFEECDVAVSYSQASERLLTQLALLSLLCSMLDGLESETYPSISFISENYWIHFVGRDEQLSCTHTRTRINDKCQAGIDVEIKDVDSYKESIWGMITRPLGDFGITFKAKGSPIADPGNAEIGLQLDAPTDTTLTVEATTVKGGSFGVKKVKVVQSVKAGNGAVIFAPSYDLENAKGDLSVAYGQESLRNVQVDVDTNGDAKLSLMQRIGDSHIIRPSITNSGDFELSYDTRIDYGTVTTTYKPNSYVNIKVADGPWQANFNAPMEGYYKFTEGAKISIKTKVNVDTGALID